MSKTNAAQLALIDLPAPPDSVARRRRTSQSRRRMSLEMTARHCNALLAELERVAQREQDGAERLAELFAAAERAEQLGRR